MLMTEKSTQPSAQSPVAQKPTASKASISSKVMERLKALDDLPHFPSALSNLERLIAKEQVPEVHDLEQVIIKDPRLTAGLIGVANTAKYAAGRKVTELKEAISLIGIKDIRVMAHAINYKSAFKTKPPFSEKQFLKHALLAGFVAQNLAKSTHINPGEAFLAGLMKDIGIYLLAVESREKYQAVITQTAGDFNQLLASEYTYFEAVHPVLSARLLKQWKFSNEIVMGVASHHLPEKAQGEYQALAFLVYLSEYGALKLGFNNGLVGVDPEDEMPESYLAALEYFGLAEELFDEVLEHTLMDFEKLDMV